ncbi:MAG: Myo-inosose-2 dehydratase [Pseudomonadota bacterium]|jgi:sugar phosphate isomerase/epimerase
MNDMNQNDNRISRRDALGLGVAAAVGASLPSVGHSANFFKSQNLPIGLQLYTVADAARKDLSGSFERLAKIGFKAIELAGYHGHSPAELKSAADKNGLKFTGIHLSDISRDGMEPGLADAGKLASQMRALGIEEVTMPIMPFPEGFAPGKDEPFRDFLIRASAKMDKSYYQKMAALLNQRGAALAKEGLRFSYHNHNLEFAPIGNTTGWDILVAETDPKSVSFEMDAGWVAAAGLDPVATVRKLSGRVRQMHVKDIKASTKANYTLTQDPTEVGSGSLKWAEILPVAHAAGVRHFYVEQEPPFTMDRFDAIAKSLRYLSGLA